MFGGGSGRGFGGIALYEMGRQAGIGQRSMSDATQAFVERLQGRQEVAVDVGPLLAENNALRYEVARLSQELANSRARCGYLQTWAEDAWQDILELRAERAKR